MEQDEIYIPPIFASQPENAKAAHAAGIDLEMLAQNLKLTPEQRLQQLQDLLNTIEELRSLGRPK